MNAKAKKEFTDRYIERPEICEAADCNADIVAQACDVMADCVAELGMDDIADEFRDILLAYDYGEDDDACGPACECVTEMVDLQSRGTVNDAPIS